MKCQVESGTSPSGGSVDGQDATIQEQTLARLVELLEDRVVEFAGRFRTRHREKMRYGEYWRI